MIWLAVPALAAAVYYMLAQFAAMRWSVPRRRSTFLPPVSILKPVHGCDPHFYQAILSHIEQDYPEFEILFGLSDPNDPALADIERLRMEFPDLPISVHIVSTNMPNAKAGVLAELAERARHDILLVSDSDILVGPGYLRAVTAPLADPGVGLVTCLYRASAASWPARAEALAIATEFVPSVLVARMLGVVEFALGSTMVFRAETLRRIGGFAPIAEYLADDYQLGLRIARLGLRIEFAPAVVVTDLGGGSLRDAWRHQVRWSRTIRVSRPAGYYGYIVTHATLWSLVALAAGQGWAAFAAFLSRMISGMTIGAAVLRDPHVLPYFWLIPLRDCFGFAVWLAGAFGKHVVWRGHRLRLTRDGRIAKEN